MSAPSAALLAPRGGVARRLELLARGYAALTADDHSLPVAPGQRRWRCVAATPEYDAWLIAWGSSSGIELHDHGDSTGAIHVVRGALVERFRDRVDSDDHPLDARKLSAHGTVFVPATRVHEVRNPFRVDALSVHVYSPPLGSASDLG
jgi:Cysteine dioxygenase type I